MAAYCPKRGDVIWISFNPQAGHRPALVLSPQTYNRKVGMVLLCPVTNPVKGYPFEVCLPDGLKASGAVLSDQVKSMDWRARKASFLCRAPDKVIGQVLGKVQTLMNL